MERSEYRSLLGRLPIKSPSPEDMVALCPHLTADQAVEAFTSIGNVAVPPVRISNRCLVLSYVKEWEKCEVVRLVNGKPMREWDDTDYPPFLELSFVMRWPPSNLQGTVRDGQYKYMESAIQFAEANWGNELVVDDWAYAARFFIKYPTYPGVNACPGNDAGNKVMLGVAFKCHPNDIFYDQSKPQSELLDDAVSLMTMDLIEYAEFSWDRGMGMTYFNCANCGSGISSNRCTGCGYTFPTSPKLQGRNHSLSRKMVDFLRENGHTFNIDPQIARDKERDKWVAEREAYEHLKLRRKGKR